MIPKPAAKPVESYGNWQTVQGISAACEPLTDGAESRQLFGADLVNHGVLPIFVVTRNDRHDGSVLLRPEGIRLKIDGTAELREQGGKMTATHPSAAQYVALGPLFARAEARNLDRDAENRMADNAIRSRTLLPGGTDSGFVYFPIEQSWTVTPPTALVVETSDPESAAPITIELPLGRDLGPGVAARMSR